MVIPVSLNTALTFLKTEKRKPDDGFLYENLDVAEETHQKEIEIDFSFTKQCKNSIL